MGVRPAIGGAPELAGGHGYHGTSGTFRVFFVISKQQFFFVQQLPPGVPDTQGSVGFKQGKEEGKGGEGGGLDPQGEGLSPLPLGGKGSGHPRTKIFFHIEEVKCYFFTFFWHIFEKSA